MGSFLVIFLSLLTFAYGIRSDCPCVDAKLCERVTRQVDKEVLAFSINDQVWKHYDWSLVTTVVVFHDWDNELMCFAHSKGVKVVMPADYDIKNLANETMRSAYIAKLTDDATKNHADGINIDIEGPVEKDSKEAYLLTKFTAEVYTSFKNNLPGSQVSFDVPWSPNCTYGRCYDVVAMSHFVDFFVIMAYDEIGQILSSECIAYANSPSEKAKSGIMQYMDLQIKPDQLVLALPWYGYSYPCEYMTDVDKCHIKKIPSKGCGNSDGSQVPYSSINDLLLSRAIDGRKWDNSSQSPYFDYYDMTGKRYQMWYDDPQSLAIKLNYVKVLNMRGSAMWNSDLLDYSPLKRSVIQTKEMWQTLAVITA